MATAGKVVIDLVARSAKLEAGIKKSQKKIKALERNVKSLRRSFKSAQARTIKWGAALTALAAVAVVAVIRSQLNLIDTLDKTSKKLGIAANELQGLRLAAELSGVPIRQLDLGIQRMTRRVAEAAIGTGEAQQAIKDLGIDAKKLAALPLEKQMQRLARAFAKVTDSGERVRLGFKLFDSEGVALINLLDLGEEGLIKVSKRAKELGLSLSAIEIAQVVAAKDAITELKAAFTAAAQKLTVAFAPAISALAKDMSSLASNTIAWGKAIAQVVVGIAAAVVAMKLWRIAVQATAKAQVVLLALQGKKGWAIIAAGAVAATSAVLALNAAFGKMERTAADAAAELSIRIKKGITDTIDKARAEVERARAALSKLTDKSSIFNVGGRLGFVFPAEEVALAAQNLKDFAQDVADAEKRLAAFKAEAATLEVEALTRSLQAQVDGFIETSLEANLAELALRGASDAALELARSTAEFVKELETHEAFTELADALDEQIATFGKSANEVRLYKLALAGATEEQLAFARSQIEIIAGMNKQKQLANKIEQEAKALAKRLKSRADSIFDATRTPLEQFNETMQELRELLAKDFISDELFDRAKKLADLALVSSDKTQRQGQFRQVRSLASIAIGGGSKLKAPTAKLQEEANKKLDGVIAAVETAGREPVLIRFV